MTPRDARAASAAKVSAIGRRATSIAEAALAPHKVRAAEAAVVDQLAYMRARRKMGRRRRRKVRKVSTNLSRAVSISRMVLL